MKIKIYTDGSYNKEANICGSAAVIVVPNQQPRILSRSFKPESDENGWNVSAEIDAVLMAMETIENSEYDEIEICHDYEGVAKWVTGEWKAKKAYTKRYAKEMKEYLEKMNISFTHVKGHSGDHYNDMADFYAKKVCGI